MLPTRPPQATNGHGSGVRSADDTGTAYDLVLQCGRVSGGVHMPVGGFDAMRHLSRLALLASRLLPALGWMRSPDECGGPCTRRPLNSAAAVAATRCDPVTTETAAMDCCTLRCDVKQRVACGPWRQPRCSAPLKLESLALFGSAGPARRRRVPAHIARCSSCARCLDTATMSQPKRRG